MRILKLLDRSPEERGAAAIIVAVFVTSVALILSAFVTEFGAAFSNKRVLQNAVDAAALAAASHVANQAPPNQTCLELYAALTTPNGESMWPHAESTMREVAQDIFDDNVGNMAEVGTVGIEPRCDDDGLLVEVAVTQQTQTPIGQGVGTDKVQVAVSATALVTAPGAVLGLRPIGMPKTYADAAAAGTPGSTYSYPLEKGGGPCDLHQSDWGLLNLDKNGAGGEGGAVDLMEDGYDGAIVIGETVEGQHGWKNPTITALNSLAGETIVVPVFDTYTPHNNKSTKECEEWQEEEGGAGAGDDTEIGDETKVPPGQAKKDDEDSDSEWSADEEDSKGGYHIIGFLTIEVVGAVHKGDFSFKYVRFSPVGHDALPLGQDMGTRMAYLAD